MEALLNSQTDLHTQLSVVSPESTPVYRVIHCVFVALEQTRALAMRWELMGLTTPCHGNL